MDLRHEEFSDNIKQRKVKKYLKNRKKKFTFITPNHLEIEGLTSKGAEQTVKENILRILHDKEKSDA